ncbi:hypothetical protein [Pseudonocardia kunmingensis]|uniref:hypothetical protein n=1 Tax=Pseudonocardia kunmingensis TaxID=630975 RepID=UPI0014781F8B|nr:hypothetical protein [Pseudonocardia kunmingensis]
MSSGATSEATRWVLSRSGTAAVVVAVAIAAGGLVLSRVDMALLALPFVVMACRNRDARPGPGSGAAVAVDLAPPARGEAEVSAAVTITCAPGVDGAALRVSSFGGAPRRSSWPPAPVRSRCGYPCCTPGSTRCCAWSTG